MPAGSTRGWFGNSRIGWLASGRVSQVA